MEQLNMTANFTNSTTFKIDFAPAVLMTLCFVVGFPGNVAVLILRPNWQKLSRLTQCLMMNLAVSDLLSLVTLPIWICNLLFNWTLNEFTCKIGIFVVYCCLYCSLLTIAALSVQRYMQVAHPQRCVQCEKRLLVLLWLMSLVLGFPALLFRKNIKKDGKDLCLADYSTSAQEVAVLLTESFVGFSSLIITTCAYILLRRKLNQAVFFNNTSTFKLLNTIIVTFFVMWTPHLTFNLVTVGGILTNNTTIIKFYYLGFVCASVAFINSVINPLLYAFSLNCKRATTNQ